MLKIVGGGGVVLVMGVPQNFGRHTGRGRRKGQSLPQHQGLSEGNHNEAIFNGVMKDSAISAERCNMMTMRRSLGRFEPAATGN
jgi:hypothetical protein